MDYEIVVDFDDRAADVVKSQRYFEVLEKYDAKGIGNDKTKTSSMFVSSEKPLDVKGLAKELGDIKILSVKKS